jgi:hypothetical protein
MMLYRAVGIGLAALLGTVLHLAAQEKGRALSLQQIEEAEALTKALSALDKLKNMTGELTAAKTKQCLKAIGEMKFCTCIAERSPVGISFVQYVAITVGSKADFKYEQMSSEEKQMFDGARKAREECVK